MRKGPAKRADVLVIGGGIGGLSAALALSRKRLKVRVYEKALEFGEVGAGLQLAPNCTRILDDYGLLDDVVALGVQPEYMIMKDALDGTELTRLDLLDVERRYGYPYLVVHRSDLHRILQEACMRAGVDLVTGAACVAYQNTGQGARVSFENGSTDEAEAVIAADGLHSVARRMLADDEPVDSAYVAYRGVVPVADVRDGDGTCDNAIVLHVGPKCHLVQYPLRGGRILNQVAVFESPRAVAGLPDQGNAEELESAFQETCVRVREGLKLLRRDRRWRIFDRDPIDMWVTGRIVLLGDAAHPPLQYLAQGAVMAVEDSWVLAEHVGALRSRSAVNSGVDWVRALAAYEAVRTEHCRRVQMTARSWGAFWHLDGLARQKRNALLRGRDIFDYSFTDWIFSRTALNPEDEPDLYRPISLDIISS